MMFMNRWEIDEAERRFASDPILGPATRTLAHLRDAADDNSDGWAYWPKPCRAAGRLQELIQRAERQRFGVLSSDVTADEVRAAYRPIKAFRTRTNIQFTIEEPS
jgi:hypothetical protein